MKTRNLGHLLICTLTLSSLPIAGGACSDSRADDMRRFCNPPEESKKQMLGVSMWLAKNLKREDSLRLLNEIADLPADQAATKLAAAAREAGLVACPLADEFRARAARKAK